MISLAGVVGCFRPTPVSSTPESIPVADVLRIVSEEVRRTLQEPLASEFSERSLVVTIENDYMDQFRLFRVIARGIGHGERFVLASVKSTVYRLAGFGISELAPFARDAEIVVRKDTLRVARLLTFLADPNGHGEVLGPSILDAGVGIPPEAETLLRAGIAGCNESVITVETNGTSTVRMIAVSRAEEWHSVWRAYCYKFTFGADGYLVDWAINPGPRSQIR